MTTTSQCKDQQSMKIWDNASVLERNNWTSHATKDVVDILTIIEMRRSCLVQGCKDECNPDTAYQN